MFYLWHTMFLNTSFQLLEEEEENVNLFCFVFFLLIDVCIDCFLLFSFVFFRFVLLIDVCIDLPVWDKSNVLYNRYHNTRGI